MKVMPSFSAVCLDLTSIPLIVHHSLVNISVRPIKDLGLLFIIKVYNGIVLFFNVIFYIFYSKHTQQYNFFGNVVRDVCSMKVK